MILGKSHNLYWCWTKIKGQCAESVKKAQNLRNHKHVWVHSKSLTIGGFSIVCYEDFNEHSCITWHDYIVLSCNHGIITRKGKLKLIIQADIGPRGLQ